MPDSNEPNLQAELSVVRGNPTEAELAAVIALLTQAREEELSHGTRVASQPKSTWAKNASILRNSLTPGLGQWGAQFRRGF